VTLDEEIATTLMGEEPSTAEAAPVEATTEQGDEVKVTHQRAGPKRFKPPNPGLNTTSPPVHIPTPKTNQRSNRLKTFDETLKSCVSSGSKLYEYEGRDPIDTNEWCDLYERSM